MKRAVLLGGVLAALILVWGAKHVLFPNYQPCPACDAGGAAACGAPGCEHGRVTCNGSCLRKDTPGWQLADIPNSPPDLLWKGFTNDDGTVQWVSQNHLGQSMEKVNGKWTLGVCRVCNGTTRMPCPSCQAKNPCPRCGGKGQLNPWF